MPLDFSPIDAAGAAMHHAKSREPRRHKALSDTSVFAEPFCKDPNAYGAGREDCGQAGRTPQTLTPQGFARQPPRAARLPSGFRPFPYSP
jgi:hypothetical protein